MLQRRLSSRASSPTIASTSASSSSSSLSSTAAPSPTFPADDSDDVVILDVPLKSRLRERKAAPAKTRKRKKKRGGGGEDDEEDDEDESDGNEDDVSDFSDPEGADDDDGEEDDDASEDDYAPNRRSSLTQQRGGGRPVTREEIAELKAVIGSHLSNGNYIQLIKQAQYDVNLAANKYYAEVGGAGEEKEESKEPAGGRKQNRNGRASPAADSLLSPPARSRSRASARLSIASTASSTSSASPSPALPYFASASSFSSSAWPDVRKPGSALDARDSAESDEDDRPVPRPRAMSGWGRGRQRGGMTMLKGKKGKGILFDPNAMSGAPRAADSSLLAHQRMSAYAVDEGVDVKMNGKWSVRSLTVSLNQ